MPAARDEVVFCPFCRDAFEGLARCPDHDLPLVPWHALPRSRVPPAPDMELPGWSPALGRGLVGGGAALTLFAFLFLPLAQVHGTTDMGGSMLRLALAGAHKLWLVPAAAATLLITLHRRRTPQALRGARLAVLLLATVAPASAAWTWFSAREAIALLAQRTGGMFETALAPGGYLVFAATVPIIVGALRLGGAR